VFDLRAEAEMRLHSDQLAREIALKKQREEGDESGEGGTATPASPHAFDTEPAA